MTLVNILNTKFLIAIRTPTKGATIPFFNGIPITFPLLNGYVTVDSVTRGYSIGEEIISSVKEDFDFTTATSEEIMNSSTAAVLSKTVWKVGLNLTFAENISNISGSFDAILSIVDAARFELNKIKFAIVTKSLFMTNLYLVSAVQDASRPNQTLSLVFSSEDPIKLLDSKTKRFDWTNTNTNPFKT